MDQKRIDEIVEAQDRVELDPRIMDLAKLAYEHKRGMSEDLKQEYYRDITTAVCEAVGRYKKCDLHGCDNWFKTTQNNPRNPQRFCRTNGTECHDLWHQIDKQYIQA